MRATQTDRFTEVTRLIREQEVGRFASIETPFGRRLLSYADLTATGRYLRFVDRWMDQVRPFYANTHTEVSSTGRLVTGLRETARDVIHRAVNAGADDEVVFVGSGATAAINKLVGLLGLRISEPLDRKYRLSEKIPREDRPVVFVGPYEHHSNLLPWLESIAEVVEIGLGDHEQIDLEELESRAREYAHRPLRIGSFSAASNVTGVLTDVCGITRVLHGAGCLAFFDYAAAAPYVPIDMRSFDPAERIDALFLSIHKFIGGPEGSGILVANRRLFRTNAPERPGGGTVDYVAGPDTDLVDYVRNLAEREEGGTPAIMSDVRSGAAFLVKEMIGPEQILEHEIELAYRAMRRLQQHPRIRVLGPTEPPRLAIISLIIEDLHHDLVSVLLDHLFGIQNRAGCSCAGPYGHQLLGIDLDRSSRFRELVQRGIHGIKPGWVRLSLPYYASENDIEFILSAVEFVAEHGMHFVPIYRMGWQDGVWRHRERPTEMAADLELSMEALEAAARSPQTGSGDASLTDAQLRAERARYFQKARESADALRRRWEATPPRWSPKTGDPELDELVWFRYVHTDGLSS
jgi:selenocysteine lyase/cysteine desulfurase